MPDRDLLSLTSADIERMTIAEARRAVAEARAEIMEIYTRAVATLGLDPKILDQDIETIAAAVRKAMRDRT